MRIDVQNIAAKLSTRVVYDYDWSWAESTQFDDRIVVGMLPCRDSRFSHLDPLTKAQRDLIALHELGHQNEGYDPSRYLSDKVYTLELEAAAWIFALDIKGVKLSQREWALIDAALGSYVRDYPLADYSLTPKLNFVLGLIRQNLND